jgi:hypothetical protein
LTIEIWWDSSYIRWLQDPTFRICKNSFDSLQFPNFSTYSILWRFWKKKKHRTLGVNNQFLCNLSLNLYPIRYKSGLRSMQNSSFTAFKLSSFYLFLQILETKCNEHFMLCENPLTNPCQWLLVTPSSSSVLHVHRNTRPCSPSE